MIEDDDNRAVIDKLVMYVNFLSQQLENVINHTNYIGEMLNNDINYSEMVANKFNEHINYTNYLGNKMNDAINYTEKIGQIVNEGINYSEMVGTKLGDLINYSDALATKVNEAINYADYGFVKLDEHIDYTNYMANIINNRGYAAGNVIGATNRNLDQNVVKLTEGVTNDISKIIEKVKENSNMSVLESKYPFLRLITDDDKSKFFALDNETKTQVVATLDAGVYFNREDVITILEGVVADRTSKIPAYVKFMPVDYKPIYEAMNDVERINLEKIASSPAYAPLSTAYQVKMFWANLDLNPIKDRMTVVSQKIDETLSTEGNISVDQLRQVRRGYSDEFVKTFMRR